MYVETFNDSSIDAFPGLFWRLSLTLNTASVRLKTASQ